MRLIIDGKECTANPGETLLEAARRSGIDIPTLCHHSALPAGACCRLCLVEVSEEDGGGDKTVASCAYPAAEGQMVRTQTEKLRRLRGGVLTILRERAPAAECLEELCRKYGAEDLGGRFHRDPAEKCVLCGLCVKACALLGTASIAAANRGVSKKVMTPLGESSATCMGCGACASVCPTGAIALEQSRDHRTVWGKTFTMAACSGCGQPYATTEQADWLARRGLEDAALCDKCKRRKAVAAL